jgi:arabinan endo-1,5-alpha-L-arabinosidase
VDPYFGKRLLGGGHKSIEGPYILYDAEAGYYYLYVSYGSLTSNGGYQIRVFRSETVDGDYVDMNGQKPEAGLNHSYYGLKLSGNYFLPSLNKAYMATGHNSAFIDEDGKRYICYHTRFDDGMENHSPRVKQYFLNEEGWPCMLPYATDGETIAEDGYDKSEVIGTYYMIDQGTDISADIAEPVMMVLAKNGKVYMEEGSGTWEMTNGSCYVHITLDDTTYSGVFCRMNDEAGTEVMTFTAVGDNESIWGVKYE